MNLVDPWKRAEGKDRTKRPERGKTNIDRLTVKGKRLNALMCVSAGYFPNLFPLLELTTAVGNII